MWWLLIPVGLAAYAAYKKRSDGGDDKRVETIPRPDRDPDPEPSPGPGPGPQPAYAGEGNGRRFEVWKLAGPGRRWLLKFSDMGAVWRDLLYRTRTSARRNGERWIEKGETRYGENP